MKIRKGDLVVVTAGDDSSASPRKVLEVLGTSGKVVVEGINRVFKHVKRGHPKSPQGGRLSKEMPVDASNLAVFCDKCGKGVRVGYSYAEDGTKRRVCKKCDHVFNVISKANPKYASK